MTSRPSDNVGPQIQFHGIMRISYGFALLGAAIMAISSGSARAEPTTVPVQKFSKVQVCTPFSVLIKPGTDYAVTVDAVQSVKAAISSEVSSDGTLTLGTAKVRRTAADWQ